MNYKFSSVFGWLPLALICFGTGCASIAPPSGGPEDKTNPFVIGSFPDSNAVRVDPDTDISILFSEPIVPSTFVEALFISPPSFEVKKIRWKKNRAFIKFDNSLPENQTVVITVGSILQDRHRNGMSESFTLAFSTGESLAGGQISGAIKGDSNAKGMIVGAWRTNIDTLIDPSQAIAPFVTQVGESNTFRLTYLSAGTYRVMVWNDRNRDRLYDPAVDNIGLPYKDIVLAEDGESFINFFVTKLDTGKAYPLMVSALDQEHVSIRFNRTPTLDLYRLDRFAEISDSIGILEFKHGWFEPTDSTRLILRTEPQQPDVNYSLFFKKDSVQFKFKGSVLADTTWSEVASFSPKAGEHNVSEKPSGWIAFKDAITTTANEDILTLVMNDSITVPIEFQVNMANRIIWKALDILPEGSDCQLRLRYGEISDLSGNTLTDSIWTSNFSILETVELGEISGEVLGSDGGAIQVIADPVKGRGDSYKIEVDSGGKFILKNLPAGEYSLWAFEDFNLNSTYDHGSLIPFRFSERLAIADDTLTVRSRWETAGGRINFP